MRAKPGLVTYVFTPYATLPGKAATVPNFTALVAAKMDELARKRDLAKTYSNDLILASTSESLGYKYFVIKGDPEVARGTFDKYFAEIARAVDACRTAVMPKDCINAIDDVSSVPKNVVSRVP